MSTEQIPVYQQYINPILTALRDLGGSASIETLDPKVSREMRLPDEILKIPHKADRPDRSEVSYRMAWARTYLKYAGLVTNPAKGTWTLTEQGEATAQVDEYDLTARYASRFKREIGDGPDVLPDEEAESPALHELLRSELRSLFETLLARGVVLRTEQAFAAYKRFRERFGPEVLAGLDGEPLLAALHGRGTKDSLVYWLEFKDDEVFPARFGSIAGGSALKFGIYQAKGGDWWTGSSQKQVPLSVDQAVARARVQREQLLAGSKVLEAFSASSDKNYDELQRQLTAAAPDLAETSWGHKYFSLLCPELLDDFHAPTYQRHHLLKLLQLPRDGRYANAGVFVGIARELSIHPNQLCGVLNNRNGSPLEYWRVGTSTEHGTSEWPRMRDGGFMAIGWTELGDLSTMPATQEAKEALKAQMAERFSAPNNVTSRKTQEVFNFAVNVHERHVALAMEGRTVRGIGVVRGNYYYKAEDGPFGHRHDVNWIDTTEWSLPEPEGLLTTFVPLNKHNENLIAIERRILLAGGPQAPQEKTRPPSLRPVAPLSGIPARVQAALDRKSQVILYGPPGTGKTYWAEQTLWELVARAWYGKEARQLTDGERQAALQQGALSSCTFHPAYGYEDFIEGYRPIATGNGVGFQLQPGIFSDVCDRARQNPKPHFVLIDEINRGDIPRIFGELLTLLEKDKRNRELILPVSRRGFSVPENVRVVGTMNTADRSIALLDAALRRRFAFVELLPDYMSLGNSSVAGLPLGPWLGELNDRIVKYAGRDARNLQVGHAYLMQGGRAVTDPARFLDIFRDDIVPLLEEYCYGDYDSLTSILGAPLISRERQEGLARLVQFQDPSDLIAALLQSFEGLATAPDAIAADEPEESADVGAGATEEDEEELQAGA